MNKELSPQEKILIEQSRRQSVNELLEGGPEEGQAEGFRDPKSDKDRLHLSDEQLAAMRGLNAAMTVTKEVSAKITEELPAQPDPDKLHEILSRAGLEPKTESQLQEIVDQKYAEAERLEKEIMDLIASAPLQHQTNDEVNQNKMGAHNIWLAIEAEVRGSKHTHPRASAEHRQELQQKILSHIDQALIDLAEKKKLIVSALKNK